MSELAPQTTGYLQLGLEIVPCYPHSKRPIPDPATGSWWVITTEPEWETIIRDYRQANVAVVLPTSICQVDCDSEAATLDAQRHGLDSKANCWILRTSRGWRSFYRVPEEFKGHTITDKEHLRPDFLRGGLALVPPSIHPSGKPYQWAKSHNPFAIPPSDLALLPISLWEYWLSFCQPKPTDRYQYHLPTPNYLVRELAGALETRDTGLRPSRGGNYTGRCPFHDDQEPSFSVNFEKGVWLCFSGCGRGTVRQLAERLNLSVPRVWRVRGGRLKVEVVL